MESSLRTNWGVEDLVNVHSPIDCAGRHCCIHNPSDHPLKDAPMNWRSDKGIMERVCKHGVGHDDPDDLAYRRMYGLGDVSGTHGCCGCCGMEQEPTDNNYYVSYTELLPYGFHKWRHVPRKETIPPNTPFLYKGPETTVWYRNGLKFPTTVGLDNMYFIPKE